jgi:hypothetical protein
MPSAILLEAESPGDSASVFRLRLDDAIVAQGLTAAQAHLSVGEILRRIVLSGSNGCYSGVEQGRSGSDGNIASNRLQ